MKVRQGKQDNRSAIAIKYSRQLKSDLGRMGVWAESKTKAAY